MIDDKILRNYGAVEKHFAKDETVFSEGQIAKTYYQVLEGEVKMSSFSAEGKEFIQGIFSKGRSFGEPALFRDFKYPLSAISLKPTTLLCLSKEAFMKLLDENPKVHLAVTETLAERLYFKTIMSTEISIHHAGHRILTLLDYLKNDIYKIEGSFQYEVELTRQQIGDLTGLRVETVIRSLKELEKQSEIKIENRKVLR